MEYSGVGGGGETDAWKKTRSKKSRDTVPLRTLSGDYAFSADEPKRNCIKNKNKMSGLSQIARFFIRATAFSLLWKLHSAWST